MSNIKRSSTRITNKEDLDFLLNITEDTATRLSFMMECFGKFGDKRRFNPYDIIVIPPGYYGKEGKMNKEPITTTVGIWIFNKAFIEKDLIDIFGYMNQSITKGALEKINKKLSYYVIEDKIDLDCLRRYILKTQKFQPYCNILSASISEKMLEISDLIKDKKDKLFKENEEELKTNNPVVAQKIENELLNDCEEILKDDPSMDLINSGAKINWGNNFKNMFVMRGASKEPDPRSKDFSIIKSSFVGGISAEDYVDFANSLTMGPYARAKKTEVGGAWEKMMVKALEHLKVLPEGTDCHTKKTLRITFNEDNIDGWMYSYVDLGNGKYEEITSDTRDKYIGKTVNIRYSALCESKDGICNICAGHFYNRIGANNIGVACYQIASVIKVKSMKTFHDSTVKISDMEKYGFMKTFGYED